MTKAELLKTNLQLCDEVNALKDEKTQLIIQIGSLKHVLKVLRPSFTKRMKSMLPIIDDALADK